MTVSTAPALLLGIGARILLDQFTRSDEPSLQASILVGVWQGVALWYAFKEHNLGIPVAFGIAAKVFVEFSFTQDITKPIVTLVGVALGLICTEILSGVFDKPKEKRSKKIHSTLANGHTTQDRDRERSSRHRRRTTERDPQRHHTSRRTTSDITSVDSNSEMIGPRGSMSPLDREVAALRTRASLADSERRRFKEEKKWAIEQGNTALASQLSWQVKRYSTLMKSFHREADTKLIESTLTRTRLQTIDEQEPHASTSERPPQRTSGNPELPIVSVDIAQSKSGIRVNVR
ncbi:uncharacterized protein EV420DRAFT_1478062 [Desarmillaria tabescens]|uniref:Uncharacterized protein n=1 Tax=Armillaria tabescens TaxID=1929756 RepID=A0AA39N931_ARMTA|nr:uncharacterized protein EV420DRAFT_1478062 [Desarmillaria tabescens]KAK0461273.1 hypothetical protein EV420DRAFT_1478062 [Desarmillaria tabescens]